MIQESWVKMIHIIEDISIICLPMSGGNVLKNLATVRTMRCLATALVNPLCSTFQQGKVI